MVNLSVRLPLSVIIVQMSEWLLAEGALPHVLSRLATLRFHLLQKGTHFRAMKEAVMPLLRDIERKLAKEPVVFYINNADI